MTSSANSTRRSRSEWVCPNERRIGPRVTAPCGHCDATGVALAPEGGRSMAARIQHQMREGIHRSAQLRQGAPGCPRGARVRSRSPPRPRGLDLATSRLEQTAMADGAASKPRAPRRLGLARFRARCAGLALDCAAHGGPLGPALIRARSSEPLEPTGRSAKSSLPPRPRVQHAGIRIVFHQRVAGRTHLRRGHRCSVSLPSRVAGLRQRDLPFTPCMRFARDTARPNAVTDFHDIARKESEFTIRNRISRSSGKKNQNSGPAIVLRGRRLP